jgi:ABC-type nitrate/sulfonate/bicarbonate transport system substrate-binding protein
MYDAEQYVSTHEDEAAPLFAKFSGIPLDVVAKLPKTGRARYLVPDQIQPFINAAVKYKYIPKGFPAQELISPYALKP